MRIPTFFMKCYLTDKKIKETSLQIWIFSYKKIHPKANKKEKYKRGVFVMPTHFVSVKDIKNFEGTKANPLEIHSWKLWINHNNNVVVLSESDVRHRDTWTFSIDSDQDTIGLSNSSFSAFAYRRSAKLHAFLEKHGISKIQTVETIEGLEFEEDSIATTNGEGCKKLFTDGEKRYIKDRTFPNNSAWFGNYWRARVTEAHWAIVKCKNFIGDLANVLYVSKDTDIYSLDLGIWDEAQKNFVHNKNK